MQMYAHKEETFSLEMRYQIFPGPCPAIILIEDSINYYAYHVAPNSHIFVIFLHAEVRGKKGG